jgi:hypothetical protein
MSIDTTVLLPLRQPIEGLHSIVKQWLVISTNDLLGVVNTLKVMLDTAFLG